ncbi:MAG: phosphoribosylanthranilate isomerase [Ruminiclostridium sp.]|nr:phosphoribosylanthranilate isomerase [Ruminiclostridium sp.]
MSTKIKICGITCENEIKILNKYLPDFAGFVFAESKRKISAETAKDLAGSLDQRIKKVGVFVNMEIENLAGVSEKAGLDIVQLHGDESQDYIDELRMYLCSKTQIWKAVRITGKASLNEMSRYRADFFLTDTYVKGVQGGSGKQFDWSLLMGIKKRDNMVIAGGLTPDNVHEAISSIRPYGVDVSSGVETDGKKNELLVGKFITRVRKMEG